jgi:hypothetical protein
MRLSVGAIVSSVAVCVAYVFVTATVAPEIKLSCVTWNRDGCNLLRRARQREMRLSVGAIVSSVAVCVALPQRKLQRESCGCLDIEVYEYWSKSSGAGVLAVEVAVEIRFVEVRCSLW